MIRKYEKPQIGFTIFKTMDKVSIDIVAKATFSETTPKGIGDTTYSKVKGLTK